MTTLAARRSTVVPLLAVAGAVVLAVSTQLAAVLPAADPLGLDEPLLDAPLAATEADDVADAPFDPVAELDGVRADVTFWADRLAAAPGDIVAAVKLAEADAAVVYHSDVVAAKGSVTGVEIPSRLNTSLSYPVITLSDDAASRAFVAYLLSAKGLATVQSFGFGAP
jgi:ABC-type molybdate transport system substrate-binding protein